MFALHSVTSAMTPHRLQSRSFWLEIPATNESETVASTDLVSFVNLESNLSDAVADATEQPHDAGTGQSRCARSSWEVSFHLKEVDKAWVSLKVRVSSNPVNEPTRNHYNIVSNNYNIVNNNNNNNSRKISFHLKKVNKACISLQVRVSSNPVNEPTRNNYNLVSNNNNIVNNNNNNNNSREISFHLKKVDKACISLQVGVSSNPVDEPTRNNYSIVNNNYNYYYNKQQQQLKGDLLPPQGVRQT